MAGNEFDAEDAVQHALLSAWEKLEQLDDPLRAERWLFSIAKNHLISRARRAETLSLPHENELPVVRSAEDEALDAETERLAAAFLDELPAAQRQAVYCCCMLGVTPAELGKSLHLSAHTVSARLYRGRETLRKRWEETF